MGNKKTFLKYLDTYVFIDVSNIRLACMKTLGFRPDFVKILRYFQSKSPNLRDIRYYEGIADVDEKKRKMFDFLGQKGYTICSLERKAYTSIQIEKREAKCPKCGYQWTAKLSNEHKVMKSNVDVYLASDMVATASHANGKPVRVILVSCDGDYTEAIKNVLAINPNASVVVWATPYVKNYRKNTLSARLKNLVKEVGKPRFLLCSIEDIRPKIESDLKV